MQANTGWSGIGLWPPSLALRLRICLSLEVGDPTAYKLLTEEAKTLPNLMVIYAHFNLGLPVTSAIPAFIPGFAEASPLDPLTSCK